MRVWLFGRPGIGPAGELRPDVASREGHHTVKVMIAVDESDESMDAVRKAYEVFGGDAEYSVVSVAAHPPAIPASPMGIQPDLVLLAQDRAGATERAHDRAVSADAVLPADADIQVEVGIPGPTICDLARADGTDVIVIGSHEQNIWDRLFRASVGRYIIDHAPCSVFVVR